MNEALCPLLHACCVPVLGQRRALICDTQRGVLVEVPGALLRLLEEHRGLSLGAIGAASGHPEAVTAAIRRLVDEDLAFLTAHPERFPALDRSWRSPAPLLRAILERDAGSRWSLEAALAELAALRCRHVLIRTREPRPAVGAVMAAIGARHPLTVDWQLLDTAEDPAALLASWPKISSLVFHEADGVEASADGRARWTTAPLRLGAVAPASLAGMAVNVETVCEATHHHPFFNRMVTVSADGRLRNGPSTPQVFGRIGETAIAEVIASPAFRALWDAHRGRIEDCRGCAYRLVCTDGRALSLGEDGVFRAERGCALGG
ncbi:MAG: hypothetical protein H6739_14300 [Alphaproteobacteria bacterium]|nr:hypothetical protein [Alphaproteobacteria bacterium]